MFQLTVQGLLIISLLGLHSCATTTVSPDRKEKSDAMRTMGNSLFLQGKAREGLSNLLKAEKYDPSNPDLQHEIALVYQEIREHDLALVHFKKAIQLKSNFSKAYNNMGILYSETGQFEKALECYNKAVSNILYQTPHFAYHNMGLVYYRIKDNKKAIEYYERAIDLAPYYVDAYMDLGIAYEDAGRYDDAISAYKKVVNIMPESMEPSFSVAKLYFKNRAQEESC